MFIEAPYHFANSITLVGDNTTVIGNNVHQYNEANLHKTGFHVLTHNNYKNAEIGGMTFMAVLRANLAGGNVTCRLKTAATNNLNATGDVLATLTFNNGAAAGSQASVKLPPGTQRTKFLGAIYTNAGNVTAGNITMALLPHDMQLID